MSDLRRILLLLIALTALRIVYAAQMPLFAFEAYYWLWNWHPAAGYFDHPPLIAWLEWPLAGRLLGSPLAARLPAMVLSALSTLTIFGFSRDLFGRGPAALWAAVLVSVAPIFDLNGMMLTPDNALILFTTLTWWLFWRAASGPRNLGAWTLAGLAAGLALLSKFHAWVLLPPLWIFLSLSPAHRPLLRRAGPWLALVVALVVLSPNLIWNARHDWLNYAFQWKRSALPRAAFQPLHVLEIAAAPLLTLGPVLYIAMLMAIACGWRAWRTSRDARWLYLLCAGLPLPLFLLLISPLAEISLHWPAAGYGALIVMTLGLVQEGKLSQRLMRPAILSAAIITALIHLLPPVLTVLPNTVQFKQQFVGWDALGARLARERNAMLAATPQTPVLVMARSWHTAALLGFYARLPFDASAYEAADLHNFRIWNDQRPGGQGLRGASALVVIDAKDVDDNHSTLRKKYDKFHRELDPLFETVQEVPSLVIYADGRIGDYLGIQNYPPRLREFLIFRCTGFRGVYENEDRLLTNDKT